MGSPKERVGRQSIHVESVSSVLPPCMVWNSRLEIEKPARLQAMPVTEPVTFLDQSAQVAQNPSWVLVLDIVETDVFNRRMRPGGPTCVTITHHSQAGRFAKGLSGGGNSKQNQVPQKNEKKIPYRKFQH